MALGHYQYRQLTPFTEFADWSFGPAGPAVNSLPRPAAEAECAVGKALDRGRSPEGQGRQMMPDRRIAEIDRALLRTFSGLKSKVRRA